MNSGDLHKVWEIRPLKRKPKGEEARKILEKIAAQVQPIMKKHNWRVKLLSEMCPKNGNLLGLNVGAGIHVKLRLRRNNNDEAFIPYDQVLDTMLHELCHNAHGPHNTSFYKLWDDLRKECEELMSKGISGSGNGFDLPGKRLGGLKPQPSLPFLRQTALSAAETRVRLGSLLPSGPNRLGGDTGLMSVLSPIQAAAMAAERRFRDNVWCASETYDASEDDGDENNDQDPVEVVGTSGSCSKGSSGSHLQASNLLSSKRKYPDNDNISCLPRKSNLGPEVIDLEAGSSNSPPTVHQNGFSSKRIHSSNHSHAPSSNACSKSTIVDSSTNASTNASDVYHDHAWECEMCTFLNAPLLPLCEVCSSEKPKYVDGKQKWWSCNFCTLNNVLSSDKCEACGEWRYSHGPPVASAVPNRGT